MHPPHTPIKRALLSVSDKAGLVEFAGALAKVGVELVSTGGSARAISEAGITVQDVSDLTGFPEMMDGRVKTLHPAVHGGILAVRGNEAHEAAQATYNIGNIDLVVVNLYPFEETIAAGGGYDDAVENIDIGGPAMIRAAAKNHASVTVIVEPADYQLVLDEMKANNGATLAATRQHLAAKAYARTGCYDAAISNWFADKLEIPAPEFRAFGGKLVQSLRYGENPHQKASYYASGPARSGVVTARQVQGKELSYNNINDTDAAFECVAEFGAERPVVAIIKHANPCGVATSSNLLEAYEKALRCDPVSAFGGIVALNQKLTAEAAKAIVKVFTEVIIAPDADAEAVALIAEKKNLRLLLTDGLPDPAADGTTFKSVAGGLLAQSRDSGCIGQDDLKVVTKRAPDADELADLIFAFRVTKHVKSNAIVYVKDGATVGVGAGQMSRVDSARIAARKSGDAAEAEGLTTPLAKGSVVASDAFFPFADGLLQAAEAGATAVIQPGGSMRDDEVIKAADDAGLAMVFTGMRHFRH
jgi:phosphoribosylaminoimidazolecarboxamide formyltransferase/IMP cyclohydrolase